MATKLICDTNVFYNIAKGYDVNSFCSGNEQLYYSPVTVAELIAKLKDADQLEFDNRRNVAKAIIDSDAIELPDPESYIATFFGLPAGDSIEWRILLEKFVESLSLAELKTKINVNLAYDWWEDVKKDRYVHFFTEMKSQIPGFEVWFANRTTTSKPKPRLKGEAKQELLNSRKQLQWLGAILVAMKDRAMHGSANKTQEVKLVTSGEYAHALDMFECYSIVYMQYFSDLLTNGHLPQENDLADLELFIYAADDNSVIVTFERRWVAFARNAGYNARIRQLRV